MFYVLYPFVTYLLTLPRSLNLLITHVTLFKANFVHISNVNLVQHYVLYAFHLFLWPRPFIRVSSATTKKGEVVPVLTCWGVLDLGTRLR
jgi:hypothetical protein